MDEKLTHNLGHTNQVAVAESQTLVVIRLVVHHSARRLGRHALGFGLLEEEGEEEEEEGR